MFKKNTLITVLTILIIGGGYLIFRYYFLGNPRLILENVGTNDIHNIEVAVSGNSYLIKKITQGKQKTIRVDPLTDSDIKLIMKNGNDTLTIPIYLDRASTGGYIQAKITSDSLIDFKYKRGFL